LGSISENIEPEVKNKIEKKDSIRVTKMDNLYEMLGDIGMSDTLDPGPSMFSRNQAQAPLV
jgi:hypothetical protein